MRVGGGGAPFPRNSHILYNYMHIKDCTYALATQWLIILTFLSERHIYEKKGREGEIRDGNGNGDES